MNEQQLNRVRKICFEFPGTSERLSHGTPTFFTPKKSFARFVDNHHGDGRTAVWVPAPPGFQPLIIESDPEIYFKPPYVGPSGWIGIRLDLVSDEDLIFHIRTAWFQVAPKKLVASFEQENRS
ncbi:MAG: hypothetical protein QNJ45_23100 [Ardenticatenaceae bacterium]|nr:hypothetical protein [Ardenticatenaceae bacterium]